MKRKNEVFAGAHRWYSPCSLNSQGLPGGLVPGERELASAMEEQAFIKLYVQLTGDTEAAARDVFMMLCEEDGTDQTTPEQSNAKEPDFRQEQGVGPREV